MVTSINNLHAAQRSEAKQSKADQSKAKDTMPNHTEPMTGLWAFYAACGLLVLVMWLANRNTPRGS